jgi:hypothetical protein
VAEVSADGVGGDVEPLGDLFIGEAAGDQLDDGVGTELSDEPGEISG